MSFVDELLNVFKLAAGVDPKRPTLIWTTRGEYLYNDQSESYLPLLPEFKRGISTVESLIAAVKEECRRRQNLTGDFMTVTFNQSGAMFYADDKARQDTWKYERQLSQQWAFLLQNINKEFTHLAFLRFLQGLRPSISNYIDLSREYKKVRFDGTTSIKSNPILENGSLGLQIGFNLETKNGSTNTKMPAEFIVTMPFTKGEGFSYALNIELDVSLDEDKNIRFKPNCPDLEIITEQALKDEVSFFKEKVAELKDLLILLDY